MSPTLRSAAHHSGASTARELDQKVSRLFRFVYFASPAVLLPALLSPITPASTVVPISRSLTAVVFHRLPRHHPTCRRLYPHSISLGNATARRARLRAALREKKKKRARMGSPSRTPRLVSHTAHPPAACTCSVLQAHSLWPCRVAPPKSVASVPPALMLARLAGLAGRKWEKHPGPPWTTTLDPWYPVQCVALRRGAVQSQCSFRLPTHLPASPRR